MEFQFLGPFCGVFVKFCGVFVEFFKGVLKYLHTLRWGMPGIPGMPNESSGMPRFDRMCTEYDSKD